MVSGIRALPKQYVIEVEGGSRAATAKGLLTYAFTHEEICPSPSSWNLGFWAEQGRIWQNFVNFAKFSQILLNLTELDRNGQNWAEFIEIQQNLAEFNQIWQNLGLEARRECTDGEGEEEEISP